ncbi:molybdenum cofactor guanylyltransferase [Gaetbulibacter saemankumensis]|uniref:molybdenum cofactor guanylyltransferase n=1 Tax=Gaetbulibacter saemankumensis TaxID=311208 RepID=UPI000400E822|nr:molybdenum cofactor guanylyltransferase [Gaetbulibacter saemankumensis]
MINKTNITGIILAGGKSSRMGQDKGLLKFKEQSFIQYSIDALTPLVSDIIIVSDHAEHQLFGFKTIEDDEKDAGPVSGICSGLEASKSTYNIILSCDIPFIKSRLLEKLLKHTDDAYDIIQAESKGKTMPLIAIYKKQCLRTFKDLLNQGERRLRVAVNHCVVKNVPTNFDEDKMTMNINTKEELKLISDADNS